MKRCFAMLLLLIVAAAVIFFYHMRNQTQDDPGSRQSPQFGDVVDVFQGVEVRYNGAVSHSDGRNTAEDGYNLGLKYQCVEFVKRYYYEAHHHRMPNTWGHAKDFYDPKVEDGQLNAGRDLIQYRNGGGTAPAVGDLVVFGPTPHNEYGHVAIVCEVTESRMQIVQQNPGPRGKSRVSYDLVSGPNGEPTVDHPRLLGWLRKAE